MATATVESEFAVVNVVGPVTISAAVVDGHNVFERAAMTICAGDVRMRAGKREFGLNIVIEHPRVPRHGVVASVTPFVEVLAMCVVLAMARDTVPVRIRERLVGMARIAIVVAMFSEQGKRS